MGRIVPVLAAPDASDAAPARLRTPGARGSHRAGPALALLVPVLLGTARPASPEGAAGGVPVVVSRPDPADDGFRRCLGGDGERVREAEPFVAVSPADPANLVAAWIARSAEGSAIQASASFDGGRSWTAAKTVPVNACAGGPYWTLTRASDPWVAFGPEGRAYVAAIGWRPGPDDLPDLANGILVTASPDGGRTWEAPAAAMYSATPHRWHDNVSIAADPKRPGTAWVATTRYEYPALAGLAPGETPSGEAGARTGPAAVARTGDGGRTWSEVRVVSPPAEAERVSAPQVIVDPDADRVLVLYYRRLRPAGPPSPARASLALVESPDQGRTWSEPREVTPLVGVAFEHKVPGADDRLNMAEDIVQVARDPGSGALAVAFADGRFTGGRSLAVAVTRSTDGGATWSVPVRAGEGGEPTEWLPSVAVDEAGRIGVAYLEADFQSASGPAFPVSLRLRVSSPSPSGPTATRSEILDRFAYAWPGDYLRLAAIGRVFHVIYARSTRGPEEPVAQRDAGGAGDVHPTDVIFR
jgi:hypothetical protein